MSLKAMIWAWDQDITNQSELLILLALADYANEDNECWPKYETLQEKSRVKSKATISKTLKALSEKGLVSIFRRPKPCGGSICNKYVLNISESSNSGLPAHSESSFPESESSGNEPPKVQEMNFPTSLNQSLKNLPLSNQSLLDDTPPELNIQAWVEWIQFKKDQFNFAHKTAGSELKACKQLIKLANGNHERQQAIVDQSITNGWKGLFTLQMEITGHGRQQPTYKSHRQQTQEHARNEIERLFGDDSGGEQEISGYTLDD